MKFHRLPKGGEENFSAMGTNIRAARRQAKKATKMVMGRGVQKKSPLITKGREGSQSAFLFRGLRGLGNRKGGGKQEGNTRSEGVG